MSSKTVKFASNLVPLILAGEKTSTWRLFDDKNLQVGDEIHLQEFGASHPFASAIISKVVVTRFGKLTDKDKEGHESYSSDQAMYDVYSGYYGTKVGPATELKIIHFVLQSTK